MASKKTLRNRPTRRKHAATKRIPRTDAELKKALAALPPGPKTLEEARECGKLPLFTNVSAADAAALTDALRAEGSQLIPPAPKPPEPTFTLAEFARLFGGNFAPICNVPGTVVDPLSVAMDSIDDLKNIIFLVNEHVHGDESGAGDVLSAAWHRASAALEVLGKFRDAAQVKS